MPGGMSVILRTFCEIFYISFPITYLTIMPFRNGPHREFTHSRLKSFHSFFVLEWPGWVEDAPDSWREDDFIVHNSPITAAIRIGQNERIANSETLDEDAAAWDIERDTMKCRAIIVALATHLRFAICLLYLTIVSHTVLQCP